MAETFSAAYSGTLVFVHTVYRYFLQEERKDRVAPRIVELSARASSTILLNAYYTDTFSHSRQTPIFLVCAELNP